MVILFSLPDRKLYKAYASICHKVFCSISRSRSLRFIRTLHSSFSFQADAFEVRFIVLRGVAPQNGTAPIHCKPIGLMQKKSKKNRMNRCGDKILCQRHFPSAVGAVPERAVPSPIIPFDGSRGFVRSMAKNSSNVSN